MSRRWEVLESGAISDIVKSKAYFEQLVEFNWEFYSELAFQRNRIREQIKKSLREKSKPFDFSKWQRIVRYKYSLSPLSTKGSLIDPGGRFNIGEIDPARYPVFPALYIASDKATALSEVLGRDKGNGSFSPEELALVNPASITVVSLSGKLESVIDIRERNSLIGFVNLIKNFRLSGSLAKKARKLKFPLTLVRTTTRLITALEAPDWRNWPMVFDVPAVCQIFGSIVMNAGIEAILYRSTMTKKDCLAIFPQNFLNSSSFVELDDDSPSEVGVRRIDSSNFNLMTS